MPTKSDKSKLLHFLESHDDGDDDEGVEKTNMVDKVFNDASDED